MIGGLPSVIDLLQVVQVRVLLEDSVDNVIVPLKWIILVFFLHEIEPNQFAPVCLTSSPEDLLIVLITKHLEANNNHPKGKMGMLLIQVANDIVQKTHE